MKCFRHLYKILYENKYKFQLTQSENCAKMTLYGVKNLSEPYKKIIYI